MTPAGSDLPRPRWLSGLVAFLPVGYPDEGTFVEAAEAAYAAGVDALELGITLSPPTLDGPRVAAAFDAVTIDLDRQLDLVKEVATFGSVIAVLFVAEADHGERVRVVDELSGAGVGALFVPDLTIEEQLEVSRWSPVPVGVFVSAARDLAVIAGHEGPHPAFVYLRSSGRATGEPLDRGKAMARLEDTRRRLAADIPLVVGFGVQEPDEVADLLAGGADGVIVGSVMVEAAPFGPKAVGDAVRRLTSEIRA